jgi:hypothetical protein
MQPFHVRANGRLMRITALEPFRAGGDQYVPVDCRDTVSTFTSQALILLEESETPESIIACGEVREAIQCAYLSATKELVADITVALVV